MNTTFKFKNRERVFKEARKLGNNFGGIAQNEVPVRETDILVEFIAVDKLIEQCLEYKRILIQEIEQKY